MPHLLTAGPLLPCADFPKQGNLPGMNTAVEPAWCWGGWAEHCGVLQLCSPKPGAALRGS